jgi:hypothetical protein
MQTILRNLAAHSPGELLFVGWAVLLVLSLVALVPALQGLATAASLCLVAGYPYVLLLGLPNGVVRNSIRIAARVLFVGFVCVLVVLATVIPFPPSGYAPPISPESWREWVEFMFGILAGTVVIAPSLLGAAALNDTRRYLQQDPKRESLPNFLALYFCAFGGILHVHRRVRELLTAAAGQDSLAALD